jgi:Beta propeller domain
MTDHEAGADEPDIVKTDGRRVVTVSHGVLRVVDTAPRKLTESVSIDAGSWARPVNLVLSGDRALVILPNVYRVPRLGPTSLPPQPVPQQPVPQQPQTRFVLVDLAAGWVPGRRNGQRQLPRRPAGGQHRPASDWTPYFQVRSLTACPPRLRGRLAHPAPFAPDSPLNCGVTFTPR